MFDAFGLVCTVAFAPTSVWRLFQCCKSVVPVSRHLVISLDLLLISEEAVVRNPLTQGAVQTLSLIRRTNKIEKWNQIFLSFTGPSNINLILLS